jgi:hypothetical protein
VTKESFLTHERVLAVIAGSFRLAVPLTFVRQILDAGGPFGEAPLDPKAIGVEPVSLARVFGDAPRVVRPALLLVDGVSGPLLVAVCAIEGVIDIDGVAPLPATVLTRWPGLLRGTIERAGIVLVIDPETLVGVIEAELQSRVAAVGTG